MRVGLVACLVVAGCGLSPEWNAQQRERIASAQAREAADAKTPHGQAYASCQTKVQFAMAGYQGRSFLDLEGTARANQLHDSCMDYWRRTGQMP